MFFDIFRRHKPEPSSAAKVAVVSEKKSFDGTYRESLFNFGPELNVLESSVVVACCTTLANGVAQIPFRLYRESKDGIRREPAKDHPLYRLLEDGPNPYQSQFDFREMIVLNLALTGECPVWLVRGLGGRIIEMYPWQTGMYEITDDPTDAMGLRQNYVLHTRAGTMFEVPAKDIWHLRWRGFNAVRGTNTVEIARDAVGLNISATKFYGNSLKNGARPSGLLTVEGNISDAQLETLRKSFEGMYSGASQAGRTVLLGSALKYQPLSMSAVNAQFVENREFQTAEICRFWGVMPIMVYSYDRTSTYASSEQLFLQHKIHTLDPWYRRIEESANKFLLTKKERESGLYFKFEADGLLRGDATARAEAYSKGINNGYMTPNEARALNDMNPIDGGDELFMQGAMIPVRTLIANSRTAELEAEQRERNLGTENADPTGDTGVDPTSGVNTSV